VVKTAPEPASSAVLASKSEPARQPCVAEFADLPDDLPVGGPLVKEPVGEAA
jgi:hypothetical protein